MERIHSDPIDSGRVRTAQVVRDGVIAGLLGALVVAAVHLVADVAAGEPLRTPSALGALLFAVSPSVAGAHAGVTFRFICIHSAVWILLGAIGSWSISVVDAHPRLAAVIFAGFVVAFASVLSVSGALSVPGLPPHHLWVGTLLGSAVASSYLVRRHPRLAPHIEREHLVEMTRDHIEGALDHETADLAAYRDIYQRFPDSIFKEIIEEKSARSAMLRSRCENLGLPASQAPESAHEWTATTIDQALREALMFERRTIDFYDRFLASAFEMQIREMFLRLRYDVVETTIPELERRIERRD